MAAIFNLLTLRPLESADLFPALHPPASARTLRIASLLVLLAILNAVDLACTLFAHRIGWLHEMNPIAETFLSQDLEPSLISYKLLMCIAGSTMLWRLRHSRLALAACWFIVAANCALTLLWYLWSKEVIFTYETRLTWGL